VSYIKFASFRLQYVMVRWCYSTYSFSCCLPVSNYM